MEQRMNGKQEAWRIMAKKKEELRSIETEWEQVKEVYREALVDDTVDSILEVLKDRGRITEGELKLFLGGLAYETMQLYSK